MVSWALVFNRQISVKHLNTVTGKSVFLKHSHVKKVLFPCSHGVLVFCCLNSFPVYGLLMQEKKAQCPLWSSCSHSEESSVCACQVSISA